MTITATIRGEPQLRRRLSDVEVKAFASVETAVKREALSLVAYIKANKLSDQVLKVRTGRLRRSITARFEGEGTGNFRAFVGTNVKYARAHELGFEGAVKVSEHPVREFQRIQSIAFGKQMKAPRMVTVRAHTVKAHLLNMKVPARPFLSTSLEENKDRITGNLRKAIAEALR
jgi:phage gpG-like protein